MTLEVTCQNSKCGHTWEYTGEKDRGEYVTCPKCLYKVRIPEKGENQK